MNFIHRLPRRLIRSFRTALRRALRTSLLLRIVSSSDRSVRRRVRTMGSMLTRVSGSIPMLGICGGVSLASRPTRVNCTDRNRPGHICISSERGLKVRRLSLTIRRLLANALAAFSLALPCSTNRFGGALCRLNIVLRRDCSSGNRRYLAVHLPDRHLGRLLNRTSLGPLRMLPLTRTALLVPVLRRFRRPSRRSRPLVATTRRRTFSRFGTLGARTSGSRPSGTLRTRVPSSRVWVTSSRGS